MSAQERSNVITRVETEKSHHKEKNHPFARVVHIV